MIANLHIQIAFRNNKTILKKAYHTTPFKIADITEDKSQNLLRLMLMTSSPGVLDGDEYSILIEVEEACSLELQTQSYQRLFNMKNGASQTLEVRMHRNSSFWYLPHPTVPHKASDFIAKNKIFLSSGCSLVSGEVLTCGRNLHGEKFTFSRYQNMTEVYLHNRLVIKENLFLKPSLTDANAVGQMEGFTHQSSLLYVNETAPVTALVLELNKMLSNEDICFGISALPVNGVIVRMLGYKAEQLHNLQKKIAEYLTKSTEVLNTKANVHAG